MWAAIKSRFGGNVESKKMQKTVLKQQFEKNYVSDTEGLDKAYDRFQKLINLLEVHGAAVSNEDANQKKLRALPSSWNNVALIMRNKDGIDDLDIDDLKLVWKVVPVSAAQAKLFRPSQHSTGAVKQFMLLRVMGHLAIKAQQVVFGDPKWTDFKQCLQKDNREQDFLTDYKTLMEVLLPLVVVLEEKNNVLFTETECLVLSPDFKLLDENQVLLRVPRQSNMYSFDLRNVVPSGDLTCLFANATIDESKLWHRRMGHVNFKTMNKLVKGNLVRGKIFVNDHTCVACQKGKQHKASCKTKLVSSISQPLQMLHMDLFGPTSVRSINHKTYCLVVTDDFSRFSWVFFLASKDETSGILKRFIIEIENQLNHKVKVIRCDNGTEFKNREMNELCGLKGIKREFSIARTPQQNGVAERKNRTLIEAARTMLADSLLPTSSISSSNKSSDETDEDDTADDAAGEKPVQKPASENKQALKNVLDKMMDQEKEAKDQSDAVRKEFEAQFNTASVSRIFGDVGSSFIPLSKFTNLPHDPLMPDLEDTTEVLNTGIFGNAYDDDDLDTCNSPYDDQVVGAEADFNNMEPSTIVSPIPTTRVHSIHPKDQIIRDPREGQITKISKPTKIAQALNDESWVEAIQEELIQIKIQKVWTLVDLPYGKKAIDTKWVYRNKKDERGIVVRNKARLVAQGY
ncbi:putative ribonuclease H-like domain-containing protein, partial [Tanacetum coccineum]